MKATRAIALYVVAADALTALLSPFVFWGLRAVGFSFPFERIFGRILMIVALGGLWPVLRWIGFRSWNDIGFSRVTNCRRNVFAGLALGAGAYLLAGLASLALGARSLNRDVEAGTVVSRFLLFAASGVAVAVIEETFFRGGIQGGLQRDWRSTIAVVAGSAFYAIMHFFRPVHGFVESANVHWDTGFAYLARLFSNVPATPQFGAQFTTLLLVGVVLGAAYVRTGTLYLSMGLHAGFVFALKSFAFLTVAGCGSFAQWLGAADSPTANLLTWPFLLVLIFVVVRTGRPDTDERACHMDESPR